ncbi:MAG: M23 family metallopeptidase [Anditalea sp.]
MKLNKYISVLLLFSALAFFSFYPIEKGYYLFPIKPGERNFLAGNMSEIRPNHFHTGLDIKTDGRQGLPVYAAADGYVYRMKISSFGYGNVLYLKHPNGQITTYAHLREFAPDIALFMRNEMYKEQQNELEIYLDEQTLPVKRGDIIAYSGNTGSSGGPHLHFEIRDSLDRAIDPLKFGFSEIIDRTPPIVAKVAISPLEMDSRVNGTFARAEFPVNYDGKAFYVNQPIHITGKVGIEIRGYDKLDDVYNPNGFPKFEIFHEEELLFKLDVDQVDFNLGRFLLSHTYRNSFTRLYKMPNNLFSFYQPDSPFSGAIEASVGEEKNIRVLLHDVYGNQTTLKLNFMGKEPTLNLGSYNRTAGNNSISYQNNVMIINGDLSNEGTLAKFYVHGYVMEIPMAYQGSNKRTYLWDMDYGFPDSVDICTEVIEPETLEKIPFQQKAWFSDGKTAINFENNSLLDDLYLRIQYQGIPGNPSIRINDPTDYLRNKIEVTMDATGYQGDKERTNVYLEYANGYRKFHGGEWIKENIRFKTRNFGTFVLAEDSIPPRIRPLRINSNEIRFSIGDNLSGIKNFEAFVDGKWILMRYEYKQSVIWSEKARDDSFKGEVILKVTDKANNETVYEGHI